MKIKDYFERTRDDVEMRAEVLFATATPTSKQTSGIGLSLINEQGAGRFLDDATKILSSTLSDLYEATELGDAPMAKHIGGILNTIGGFGAMLVVFKSFQFVYGAESSGRLEMYWDGVGDWEW